MLKFNSVLFYLSFIMTTAYACENYGEEQIFNKTQVFYTSKITQAEVNTLGNYLIKGGFADGNKKSVQIDKSGDTYLFRMVIKKGLENDPTYTPIFKMMGLELSNHVFNGATVDFHLCDKRLKTIKVLPMYRFGREKVFNGTQLFYTPNVTVSEVDRLGKYLIMSKFADGNHKSVQLDKLGTTYLFKMVIKKGLEQDPKFINLFQAMPQELSKAVFNNSPLDFHICDPEFKTIRVFPKM